MSSSDNLVQRVVHTRGFLDRRKNPPDYVTEELPTTTVHLVARQKQGTLWNPAVQTPGTPMIMGSMYFSGSYYETSPGTSSLRIIRRSVFIGSVERRNVEVEWALRHSRLGTLDKIPFVIGTYASAARRESNVRAEAFGNSMSPLYAVGPGTLWHYFTRGRSSRGTMRVYASMEGIPG